MIDLYRKYSARKKLHSFLKNSNAQNFISLRNEINKLDDDFLFYLLTRTDEDRSDVLLTASRFNSEAAIFFLEVMTRRLPERQGKLLTRRDIYGWNVLQNAAHDNPELLPYLLKIITAQNPTIQKEIFTNITNDGRGTLDIAKQSDKDIAYLIRDAMRQVNPTAPIPPPTHGTSIHFFTRKTPSSKSVISEDSKNKNIAKDRLYKNYKKDNSSLLVPLICKNNRKIVDDPAAIDEHTFEQQAKHKKYTKMV